MHLLSGLSIPLILLLTLANADPSTDVTLGGKYIDYGCEASIRKTLGEAFDSLCPGPEKSCDQSRSYSRKVDWADSNNPVTERDITVKIEGALPNDDVRERVRNVLINAVNPTSAKPKDITWDTIGGGVSVDYMTAWESLSKLMAVGVCRLADAACPDSPATSGSRKCLHLQPRPRPKGDLC